MAEQVISLLNNESERHAMRKRAYMFGRTMIWSEVAQRYMKSFERARTERGHYIPPGFIAKALDKYSGELPVTERRHAIHSPTPTEPDVQISRIWPERDFF